MQFRLQFERAASHGTRALGALLGRACPHIFVVEFPKSGGTWLAETIADYVGIPRPERPLLPVFRRAVIHGHWNYTPGLARVFYIYRDVRDVAISAYFRWLWEVRNPPYPQTRAYFRRRLPVLFHPEADDIRERLPQFVREFAVAPGGARLNWSEHLRAWHGRPQVVSVAYEELLRDTPGTLGKALLRHLPHAIDDARLEDVIERNSFQSRSGRRPGDADPSSFLRKGIAGDWRNHTSREAGEEFDRHFGEMLALLGYEARAGWWRNL